MAVIQLWKYTCDANGCDASETTEGDYPKTLIVTKSNSTLCHKHATEYEKITQTYHDSIAKLLNKEKR